MTEAEASRLVEGHRVRVVCRPNTRDCAHPDGNCRYHDDDHGPEDLITEIINNCYTAMYIKIPGKDDSCINIRCIRPVGSMRIDRMCAV